MRIITNAKNTTYSSAKILTHNILRFLLSFSSVKFDVDWRKVMHSLETIIARNKAQQDSFDRESKTLTSEPKREDRKMRTLTSEILMNEYVAPELQNVDPISALGFGIAHAALDGEAGNIDANAYFNVESPRTTVAEFNSRWPEFEIADSQIDNVIQKAFLHYEYHIKPDPLTELMRSLNLGEDFDDDVWDA